MTRLNATTFLILLLTALCSSLSQGFAFSSTPNAFTQRSSKLFAGKSDKEGGAAIAKPKVNIGQKTAVQTDTKQKVQVRKKNKPAEPVQRRDEDFEDAPMFKLMLLGDDSYDQVHVVERLKDIVDDMDEDAASTVFQQASQEGKAMCGKYPFERAELFKEQLQRSDPMIFTDLEEENK